MCIRDSILIECTDQTDFQAQAEQSTWWNSSWNYRKPITILNTAKDLANYQVKIVCNLSAEYLSGKINTTCKDIRFTYYNSTSESETEIPFWIEVCNFSSDDNITVWVNVTYLQNNTNTTIYMYYGNPSVDSISNGKATFVFFDNFEDGDVSDWSTNAYATVSASATQVKEGTYSLAFEDTSSSNEGSTNNTYSSQTDQHMISYWMYITGTSYTFFVYSDDPASGGEKVFYGDNGNWYDRASNSIKSASTGWWFVQVLLDANTDTYEVWINQNGSTSGSSDASGNYASRTSIDTIAFRQGGSSTYTHYIDIIKVRKYVSPEPVASVGMEEKSFSITLNSPPDQTKTSDPTPDFNFTVSGTKSSYSCELFINNTGYGTTTANNNTATIITANYSLLGGVYNWYINCTAGGATVQSEIRELTISTQMYASAWSVTPIDKHIYASYGTHQSIAKINSTHYLVVYSNNTKGYAQVLIVDNNYTISSGNSYVFDEIGKYNSLIKINSTHYLNVYQGYDNDGYAIVLAVNPSDLSISNYTHYEFCNEDIYWNAIEQINTSHYINVFYDSVNDTNYAVILKVNLIDLTISTESKTEIDDSYTIGLDGGRFNTITKIDDTHFLLVYSAPFSVGSGPGQAVVLTVNTTDWSITVGNEHEWTGGVMYDCFALAQINKTHYLGTYCLGTDGYAKVLIVDESSWNVTSQSNHKFSDLFVIDNSLEKISKSHYLNTYGTATASYFNGYAIVLTVDTSDLSISSGTEYRFDSQQAKYNSLIKIDTFHYLNAYSIYNINNGTAVTLELSLPVNITLTYPVNQSNITNNPTPTFGFGISGPVNNYQCKLIINDTEYGDAIALNYTPTAITANSSLSDGTYNWYINCTVDEFTLISETREFTIITQSIFSITLNSPDDDSTVRNSTPSFNFTVTGTENTYSCKLFIDNISYDSTNAGNNTPTVVTANSSLSDGIHHWYINCTANGVTEQSETRKLLYSELNFTIWDGDSWNESAYLDFLGLPTDKYINATYQTDTQPILNITNYYSDIKNITLYVNESAPSGYTLFCHNSSSYTNAIVLDTTEQIICYNIPVNSSCHAWCWMNYSNPESDWYFDILAGIE